MLLEVPDWKLRAQAMTPTIESQMAVRYSSMNSSEDYSMSDALVDASSNYTLDHIQNSCFQAIGVELRQ